VTYRVERLWPGNDELWRIVDYTVGYDEDVVVAYMVGTRSEARKEAKRLEALYKSPDSTTAPADTTSRSRDE
jgi:hypothetical protein